MHIEGNNITGFDVKIKPDFKVETILALRWFQLSSGYYVGIDRTVDADQYATSIRIYKDETTINDFINQLELNRVAGSNVLTLSNFNSQEHVFGADINYEGTGELAIRATVMMTRRAQKTWRGFELPLRLSLLPPFSFVGGDGSLPLLHFLDIGYDADANYEIRKFDSYSRQFTYQDHTSDIGSFTGIFEFTDEEMIQLRRYLAAQRGATIEIPGISGVTYPWGRRSVSYPIYAKVINFEDLGISSMVYGKPRWRVKITLAEDVNTLPSTLLGWWKGEDNPYDSIDDNPAAWDGGLPPAYGDGSVGRCFKIGYDFDGFELRRFLYINLPNYQIYERQYFEIEFLINIGSNPDSYFLLSCDKFRFYYHYVEEGEGNECFLETDAGQQIYSALNMIPGQFYKLKLKYNYGRWEVYVNDEKCTPDNYKDSEITENPSYPLCVFYNSDECGWETTDDCLIDEIKIYPGTGTAPPTSELEMTVRNFGAMFQLSSWTSGIIKVTVNGSDYGQVFDTSLAYSLGSLADQISENEFVCNVNYVAYMPSGKLFIWPRLDGWDVATGLNISVDVSESDVTGLQVLNPYDGDYSSDHADVVFFDGYGIASISIPLDCWNDPDIHGFYIKLGTGMEVSWPRSTNSIWFYINECQFNDDGNIDVELRGITAGGDVILAKTNFIKPIDSIGD